MNQSGDREQKRDKDPWKAELLGYALGLSDVEESGRIESRLDSAQQRQLRENVHRALAPLDLDPIPAPPPQLVQNIMARIDRASGILKFPAAGQQIPAAMEIGGSGSKIPLRELIGLAAAILLFVGILVPGYRNARSAAQRSICANNLRTLGSGLAQYTEAHASNLPFTGAVPNNAYWSPAGGAAAPYYSNQQHAFLLVRGNYVQPGAFICPGRPGDAPLVADQAMGLSDFPSPRNNSYSLDLVRGPWRAADFEPNRPLVADMNPMLDDQRRLIQTPPVPENSRSHARPEGQNVLRGDMSVGWFTTPRVGIDNDDIYRLIGVKKYTGREMPSLKSDAFLVP